MAGRWYGLLLAGWLVIGVMGIASGVEFPRDAAMERLAARIPETLRRECWFGDQRPYSDREWWLKQAKTPEGRKRIAAAEKLLALPLPVPTDELYLEFSRNGNRSRYQSVRSNLEKNVTVVAVAWCLTGDPRYRERLEAALRAFLAAKSWVLPAHDRGNRVWKGEAISIDLVSALLGWRLAVVSRTVAGSLDPELIQELDRQIRARVLTPFQEMLAGKRKADSWLTARTNWNAVCLAGVTGAALALEEDFDARSRTVAGAVRLIACSLQGFGADGYCFEGVGYWNYGYGHNLRFALMVYRATGGAVNLMEHPVMLAAGRYGEAIQMSGGVVPAFADCGLNSRVSQTLCSWRDFLAGSAAGNGDPVWMDGLLPMVALTPAVQPETAQAVAEDPGKAPLSWFPSGGVAVLRPVSGGRFAAAIKGGSNDEPHNHNDVGSYVVMIDEVPMLFDPGSEVYTRRTFSKDRYQSGLLSSFGHPVPVVDGKLQRTGGGTDCRTVEAAEKNGVFRWRTDLQPAYGDSRIRSLERLFVLERHPERIVVRDRGVFTAALPFETALIAPAAFRQTAPDVVEVSNGGRVLRIRISASGPFELIPTEIKEDSPTRQRVFRLGIRLLEPTEKPEICTEFLIGS